MCLTSYLLIKPQKKCSACKCNHCRVGSPRISRRTSPYSYSIAWVFLSIRSEDQQRKHLVVRFYSKWYCAKSGVDVLAKRFRLASNRYIVRESANIKVYLYQVMISNGLYEENNEQGFFFESIL